MKQLIIGGFEKVYEVGRVFRNEGIDSTHNPEFTTLEFYQAYTDYQGVMQTTEGLLKHVVKEIYGTTKVSIAKQEIKSSKDDSSVENSLLEIDFDKPYQQFDVMTEIQDYFGENIDLKDKALIYKLENMLHSGFPKKYQEGMNEKQLLDKLIEGVIEPKCIQPSYIMNHPSVMSPLAKTHPDSLLSERFELFVDGMEIVNAYTEQNSYELQKDAFEMQRALHNSEGASKDVEIMQTDDDYLEAMSYGMPPTGGCGIGIDRLCMLLFGHTSIREVIMFPMFRTSVLKHKK